MEIPLSLQDQSKQKDKFNKTNYENFKSNKFLTENVSSQLDPKILQRNLTNTKTQFNSNNKSNTFQPNQTHTFNFTQSQSDKFLQTRYSENNHFKTTDNEFTKTPYKCLNQNGEIDLISNLPKYLLNKELQSENQRDKYENDLRRIQYFDRKPNLKFAQNKQHWDKNIIYKEEFLNVTKTASRFPNFSKTQSTFDFKACKNQINPSKITNVELIQSNHIKDNFVMNNNENNRLDEVELKNENVDCQENDDNVSVKSSNTNRTKFTNQSKISTMSKSKLIDLKERVKLLLSRNKKSFYYNKDSQEILLSKLEKKINELDDNLIPEPLENKNENERINEDNYKNENEKLDQLKNVDVDIFSESSLKRNQYQKQLTDQNDLNEKKAEVNFDLNENNIDEKYQNKESDGFKLKKFTNLMKTN